MLWPRGDTRTAALCLVGAMLCACGTPDDPPVPGQSGPAPSPRTPPLPAQVVTIDDSPRVDPGPEPHAARPHRIMLEVTSKTWVIGLPAGDLAVALAGRVPALGFEVVDTGGEAILAIKYEESKGPEYADTHGLGKPLGTSTDTRAAIEVLRAGDRRRLGKLVVTGATPSRLDGRDMRSAALAALVEGPAMAAALAATAVLLGDDTASERLLHTLVDADLAEQTLPMLQAIGYRPRSPREQAFLLVGRGKYAAAGKLGAPAADALGAALAEARMYGLESFPDPFREAVRAYGKTGDPRAAERLLVALDRVRYSSGYSETPAYDPKDAIPVLREVGRAGDERAIAALVRGGFAGDERAEVKPLVEQVMAQLYERTRIKPLAAPGTPRTVAIELVARAGDKRFPFEQAMAAKLQKAGARLAAPGATAADAILMVDYEEKVDTQTSFTGRVVGSPTDISWSVVYIDLHRKRAQFAIGYASTDSMVPEGADLRAIAIKNLQASSEFTGLDRFFANLVADRYFK